MNGNLRVNAQARLHETKLTAGVSSLVQNEIQRIDVAANVVSERQVRTAAVSMNAIANQSSFTF